jgi:hypothetical protein
VEASAKLNKICDYHHSWCNGAIFPWRIMRLGYRLPSFQQKTTEGRARH